MDMRALISVAIGAIVAVTLLVATVTTLAVTFATAKAAGAIAVGACGAYGQAFDYPSVTAAEASAMAQCQGGDCKVISAVKRGCSAFAVDGANPCGARGWASGPRLGKAQNEALRTCYESGGKDCVIRTFICDAKG
jgi:hypothetical protein